MVILAQGIKKIVFSDAAGVLAIDIFGNGMAD
jgi:hypothetical protein